MPGVVEIVLADGFEDTGKIPRKIIEDGYRTALGIAVWVFELLYALNKIPYYENTSFI